MSIPTTPPQLFNFRHFAKLSLLSYILLFHLFINNATAFNSGNGLFPPPQSPLNQTHTLHTHQTIEHTAFSSLNIPPLIQKHIYFGNWLRDFSQIHDSGFRKRFSAELLTKIVGLLAHLHYFPQTGTLNTNTTTNQTTLLDQIGFRVSFAELGVYRPEEHADNPALLTLEENIGNLFDSEGNPLIPGYRHPVSEEEVSVNSQSLAKLYINSMGIPLPAPSSWGYVEKVLRGSIDFMALTSASHNQSTEMTKTLYKSHAYKLFGAALHTIEDFYSHSNFIELVLVHVLGYEGVYTWVQPEGRVECQIPFNTRPSSFSSRFAFIWSWFSSPATSISSTNSTSLCYPLTTGTGSAGAHGDSGRDGNRELWIKVYSLLKSTIAQWNTNGTNVYDKSERRKSKPFPSQQSILNYPSRFITEYYLNLPPKLISGFINYLSTELRSYSKSSTLQQMFWNSSTSSNPTHSQLNKDFQDHPLHDISARISIRVVKSVTQRILNIWEAVVDGSVSLRGIEFQVEELVGFVRRVWMHPVLMRRGSEEWEVTIGVVSNWVEEMKDSGEWERYLELLDREHARDAQNKLF